MITHSLSSGVVDVSAVSQLPLAHLCGDTRSTDGDDHREQIRTHGDTQGEQRELSSVGMLSSVARPTQTL